MQSQEIPPQDGYGVLARLYWMMFGYAMLLFLLVFLFEKRPDLPSLLDVVCLLVVGSLVGVRFLDVRFLNGRTADGDPATMDHWRRYAGVVGSIGTGAWVATRVLSYLLR
jgi:hypothetical protein